MNSLLAWCVCCFCCSESAALAAKKEALTSDKLAEEHRAADERRAEVLAAKIEKAKELEGHGSASREASPKREAK